MSVGPASPRSQEHTGFTDRGTSFVPIATLSIHGEAAMKRLGNDLAMALSPGDVVALEGDLGAGKSTLARAVIRCFADDETLDVPSPTYTIVQDYPVAPPRGLSLRHVDLYRISNDDDLEELGLEAGLDDGVVLIEWPGNASRAITLATMALEIAMQGPDARLVTFSARGEAAERLSRSLDIRAFLEAACHGEDRRRHLAGDASARRYETVLPPARNPAELATPFAEKAGAAALVLMDSPARANEQPVRDGLPYSRIAHLAQDVTAFVAIAEALRTRGFAAPAIRHAALSKGLLLLDHLGPGSVLDAEALPIAECYEAAASCLAEIHMQDWPQTLPVPATLLGAMAGDRLPPYDIPPYDPGAMAIEVDLLPDWYLPHAAKRTATSSERALFDEIWQALFDKLRTAETSLVLRDFHSPNIIWRPQAEGVARVGLIDFQDALLGPSAYDLASLAQDARVDIAPELEIRLVGLYMRLRSEGDPDFDRFGFERAYAITAAQRATKILGVFVRLLERDGKPQYLRHIPRIKRYLLRTLDHPSLAALKSLYEDWGILDETTKPAENA